MYLILSYARSIYKDSEPGLNSKMTIGTYVGNNQDTAEELFASTPCLSCNTPQKEIYGSTDFAKSRILQEGGKMIEALF